MMFLNATKLERNRGIKVFMGVFCFFTVSILIQIIISLQA